MYEFLKDRGIRFLKEAERNLEEGNYDFCLFHVEQMLQLLLKYLIAIRLGDYPKTHSLELLFRKCSQLFGDKIKEFHKNNAVIITALEEAYIGARYLDIVFNKQIAEEAVKFGRNFLRIMQDIEDGS